MALNLLWASKQGLARWVKAAKSVLFPSELFADVWCVVVTCKQGQISFFDVGYQAARHRHVNETEHLG